MKQKKRKKKKKGTQSGDWNLNSLTVLSKACTLIRSWPEKNSTALLISNLASIFWQFYFPIVVEVFWLIVFPLSLTMRQNVVFELYIPRYPAITCFTPLHPQIPRFGYTQVNIFLAWILTSHCFSLFMIARVSLAYNTTSRSVLLKRLALTVLFSFVLSASFIGKIPLTLILISARFLHPCLGTDATSALGKYTLIYSITSLPATKRPCGGTREPSRNFELRPLLNPRGSSVTNGVTVIGIGSLSF